MMQAAVQTRIYRPARRISRRANRERKALTLIARHLVHGNGIIKTGGDWSVLSQTRENHYYNVSLEPWICSCVDFEIHAHQCKHILAVELLLHVDAQPALLSPVPPAPKGCAKCGKPSRSSWCADCAFDGF